MVNLREKTMLVTGAAGCIGSAVAVRMAEFGAEVILHFYKEEKKARDLLAQIEGAGGRAHVVQADVSDKLEVDNMFLFIKNHVKRLDGVINCAGIFSSSYIKTMQLNDWDKLIDVNMKSIFLISKAAINLLSKSHGASIVNIASIAGVKPHIMQMAYSASKAGVISMTKSMAMEFGRFNIRVNSISPGPVRSSMNIIDIQEEKQLGSMIPLRRIAEPDDIADAAVCLCLPLSRYITGQNIVVDGGLTI